MDDVGARGAFQAAMQASGEERWSDALLAIAVLSAGRGALGGLWLTARASGVRDAFIDRLMAAFGPGLPVRRFPPGSGSDALFARLDLAATARLGRPMLQDGLLDTCRGGILVVPMAERLEPGAAAALAGGLDDRTVTVLALDEAAETDDAPPAVLTERLALHVSLDGIPLAATRPAPSPRSHRTACEWQAVGIKNGLLEQMLALAVSAGHRSARAHFQLFTVSRILAALAGRRQVRPEDAVTALRLCLGIRLLSAEPPGETVPPPPQSNAAPDGSSPPDHEPPPSPDTTETPQARPPAAPADPLSLLEAAVAQGTIDGLSLVVSERASQEAKRAGKAGAEMRKARRGRPYATGATAPFPDARPDIAATLRAAAPWQRLRAAAPSSPLASNEELGRQRPNLRRSDFRYHRRRHASPSTAIFVVDASGSTALDRLGETKGAIEQLLARCYVRRDEVALIAFRAEGADLLLPPTRSLAAAKRRLSALPGGGPTPLAAGLKMGLELALSVRRRGNTPLVVVLTDGAGNVALGGEADRPLAARQSEDIARHYRAEGLTTICVDIARRPRPAVATLAGQLGAELHVLRQSAAASLSALVNTAMTGARP